MATAKSTGGGDSLWPAGVTLENVSEEFITIVSHTLSILGWHENVPQDEIPPAWMWSLDWELEKHWELVKSKRNQDKGGGGSYTPEPENVLFEDFEREMRSPH